MERDITPAQQRSESNSPSSITHIYGDPYGISQVEPSEKIKISPSTEVAPSSPYDYNGSLSSPRSLRRISLSREDALMQPKINNLFKNGNPLIGISIEASDSSSGLTSHAGNKSCNKGVMKI
jgi:hypothetical protein